MQTLKRSLEAPARQIAENSRSTAAWSLHDDGGQGNFGFDAARKEYVDLVEAGIVDPAKVVRTALENAVSSPACCCSRSAMTEIPARDAAPNP